MAPLTAMPDDEHGDEQREAREQERRDGVAQPPVVGAREDDERHDPEEGVDGLALQVVGGVVVRERGARRARAVDHDEPERHEPERDDDEQVVLEAAAGRPLHRRLHELAEPRSPLLEALELVVARAGRREEHDLAALGIRVRLARPRARGRRSAGSGPLRAPAPRRSRPPTRRSGRRSETPASRARAASPPNGVPLRLPPRITRRPGGYAPSARSAASGFVAFESLTQRTPSSSRTSSSRCGTPAKLASAAAIASSAMPAARAAAAAAAAFSRLCSPGMRGSAGSGSSAANSTRRPSPGTGGRTHAARRRRPRALVLEDAQLGGAVGRRGRRAGRGGRASR